MSDQDMEQEELITEARSMGWVPEEEFKGVKANWVPAEDFVEKGRHVIPIMKANNERLRKDLLTRDQKIGTLETNLASATRAIEKLEKHYTEANKRAVETAKAQLREDLKQAREDGDVDAELEIQDKIAELRDAKPEVKEEKPKPEEGNNNPPELQVWYDANPWFGSQNAKDKAKTKQFVRLAEDMREEGVATQGPDFFEEVAARYELEYGEEREAPVQKARPTSKVESGGTRSGNSGKGFASLPADAKQACHEDAEDLVGPGKRYATLKDWEQSYANIYYSQG